MGAQHCVLQEAFIVKFELSDLGQAFYFLESLPARWYQSNLFCCLSEVAA